MEKRKRTPALLSIMGEEDGKEGSEKGPDEGHDEKHQIAEEILEAFESKDAKGLASGLSAFFACCESEPHSEE